MQQLNTHFVFHSLVVQLPSRVRLFVTPWTAAPRPPCPSPSPGVGVCQVHIYCISDAIQSSHPLMPSFPSALNPYQHQGLFQCVVYPHQMTKILELQLHHQSFQRIFRLDSVKTDWFDLLAVQGKMKMKAKVATNSL